MAKGYLLEVEKKHTLAGILCNIKDMGEGDKESENSKITWCGAGRKEVRMEFKEEEAMDEVREVTKEGGEGDVCYLKMPDGPDHREEDRSAAQQVDQDEYLQRMIRFVHHLHPYLLPEVVPDLALL